MSNYKIIEVDQIVFTNFVNIEHEKKKISLSIHKGTSFQEVMLTPEQAKDIANELLIRANQIKEEEEKDNEKHDS